MKKSYLNIAVVVSNDREQLFFTKSINMDYVFGSPDQQIAGINHQLRVYFEELKRLGYKIDSFNYQVVELKDNLDMEEAE